MVLNKYDSQSGFKDSLAFFQRSKDKDLNAIICNNYEIEPQELDDLLKRPPPISLQMDFVYGFECFSRRQTLFYIHFYDDTVEQDEEDNLQLGSQKKN